MRVQVLLFGVLKDVAVGFPGTLELPEGARVDEVLQRVRATIAGHETLWASLAVAVNREYARADRALRDGDEVALLPPVSGGSSSEPARMVALTREPIDAAWLVAQLKRGSDGAVTVFDGIVRDNTRGRRTLYLDYDAYEEMALEQMRSLVSRALADFAIRDVALVHRLGRLEVGETSVLIAVASPHRAAAFDACRWLIDTLKRTVPIWKKEHFEDGAVWADGEPFPPEMRQ